MRTAGWAVAGVGLFLVGPLVAAQELPVFSSGIEVVSVDVAVLREGKAVQGLQAGDFELRDNGVLQEVEIAGRPRGPEDAASKPVDVVLALDVSDSVKGGPLEQLKDAARAFVDLLHSEDSFSLLTFSSRVRLAVSPSDSREVIQQTQAQLTTSLYDAAFAALVITDARRGRPLVLVLSDGQDHGSWLKPEQVLRAAEGSELVVHAVITRPTGNEPTFLPDLAAATGGETWRADYGELRDVLARALEEFRSRYTLRYERRGVAPSVWHELGVRVRRPGVKVRARSGYAEEADPPVPGQP
jgi:VWFA-related protein